jgi:hypothetical protein
MRNWRKIGKITSLIIIFFVISTFCIVIYDSPRRNISDLNSILRQSPGLDRDIAIISATDPGNVKSEISFGAGKFLSFEDSDSIPILYLQGTPYDIGYQHGYLLKDRIGPDLEGFIQLAERWGCDYANLTNTWALLKPFVPFEYLQEMQGLSDASGFPLDRIEAAHAIPAIFHCSSIAAWNQASPAAELYLSRSLDFPIDIIDNSTGIALQENTIIMVVVPASGIPFLSIGWAGFIGSVGGINNASIAIAEAGSSTTDFDYRGFDMIFRVRKALEQSQNLDQAVSILIEPNRTAGYNFIVADGKTKDARVIEVTKNTFYVGAWDNATESLAPHWEIPYVLRRTNSFIDPLTSATQRSPYNPKPMKSSHYSAWIHYKELSNQIEKYYGQIDLVRLMEIQRTVYQGKTNLLFDIVNIPTIHQWVSHPISGDILVSKASKTQNAYDRAYFAYNLAEILQYCA